ncbi:MAG: dienelactone hydrolase family protein [Alphaproteobacteria bacterium]
MSVTTAEVSVDVAGSAMRVHVATPEGPGPHPAVLIAHHRGGVDEFTCHVAGRMAAIGLVGVAPDFYHRRPAGEDPVASMSFLKDGELVTDINATVDHMIAMASIKSDAIGIVGHCLGGRTAYLALVWRPIFKAAIILYHGNIFQSRGEGMPAPFEMTDRFNCPVAGFFGNEDKNPSPEMVDRLVAEFDRLHIPYEFHRYDGAGHAFQDHTAPNYRAAAAVDAWPKMLDFLGRTMFR